MINATDSRYVENLGLLSFFPYTTSLGDIHRLVMWIILKPLFGGYPILSFTSNFHPHIQFCASFCFPATWQGTSLLFLMLQTSKTEIVYFPDSTSQSVSSNPILFSIVGTAQTPEPCLQSDP